MSALRTGIGVSPPIAHSEPSVITLAQVFEQRQVLVAVLAATIRSMTSTPRTEPTRHGVHLPQDSAAQNSMANRAWAAMSTVSSKTTMPPCPTIAPAAANAS